LHDDRAEEKDASMRIAVVALTRTPANLALADVGCRGVEWAVLTPDEALAELRPGDAAIGRLDVSPSLDGVDDGMWVLGALEARGVTVLNGAPFLLAAHDKLLTARLLRRAGLPHPRTRLLAGPDPVSSLRAPAVVKPRFGSWGLGVERCDDEAALEALLAALPGQPWYRAHGALVQELVTPVGFDLRVVVAAGEVIGAISRVAAPGEWRTNVALGAERRPATPPPDACAIALAAAEVTGAALVGVDLLPDEFGRWTIVELNGAVEFTPEYALRPDTDPFADAAFRLAEAAMCARVAGPAHVAPVPRG
jgi:[lysine-biosynthesis-protein LysW]--L-2-aminoadipate ligase